MELLNDDYNYCSRTKNVERYNHLSLRVPKQGLILVSHSRSGSQTQLRRITHFTFIPEESQSSPYNSDGTDWSNVTEQSSYPGRLKTRL